MKRITKRLQNRLKRISKHSILLSNIENMNEKRNESWRNDAYILVNSNENLSKEGIIFDGISVCLSIFAIIRTQIKGGH